MKVALYARNKKLINLVLKRDIGLCVCCGFKATEVHHIIPLCMGGLDNMDNMVAICSTCHRFAPDTEEEFNKYCNNGGHRIPHLYGIALINYHKDELYNNHSFKDFMKLLNSIVSTLRQMDFENATEKYSIKESLQNYNNVNKKGKK
jgi:hypothetical protein